MKNTKLSKAKNGAPRVKTWYHFYAWSGRIMHHEGCTTMSMYPMWYVASRTRRPIHPRGLRLSLVKCLNSWSSWCWDKIFFSFVLIVLGILFRTAWHVGPNIEFVTSATLLALYYLGKRWGVGVAILIMLISDLIIGTTNIFIFTWSAYVIIGLVGYYIFKEFRIQNSEFRILKITGLGVGASIWFYLWTNFGVWLLDAWGMYDFTLMGLIGAYIMGLPFLKFNLIGNILFVPASFLIVELGIRLYPIVIGALCRVRKGLL